MHNATSIPEHNHRIVLSDRPVGLPGPEHFRSRVDPVRRPKDTEVLLETLYVSLDPAMRVWMDEKCGYIAPVALGETMRADGIARVIESASPKFKTGDLVECIVGGAGSSFTASLGWQSHPTLPADCLNLLDPNVASPIEWLGPLGMSGLTAYYGFHLVGRAKPEDTVLVSAASGAVGQMVVQLAQQLGCRVIGLAGGPEKCRALLGDLKIDGVIDYRQDLKKGLDEHCAEGVDLYFDNVGGEILEAVIPRLKRSGRSIICGRISQTAGQPLYGVKTLGSLIGSRGRVEAFLCFDHYAQNGAARAEISALLKAGRLKQRSHVVEGLENAPAALRMLFTGENHGKLVVKVPPTCSEADV